MRAAMARSGIGEIDDLDELDSPSTEGLETGSLAIKDTKPKTQKELWQRPTKRMPPQDGRSVLRFEISYARVMPLDGEHLNLKRFVVYDLSVRQDSVEIDANPAMIQRRYTDFANLNNTLRKSFPEEFASTSLYFPKKVLMGNFSPDLIAERGTAFEFFLEYIASNSHLKESHHFLYFLQNNELSKACQFLDERRNELAVPLLENCFTLLNKIFMDRSRSVLLILCRLVAACTTSPVPHANAEKWAELALRRYEGVCDTELLSLYIPLLHTCAHLWWQRGRDKKLIMERLTDLAHKGMTVNGVPSLTQAIHKLDPRTELV